MGHLGVIGVIGATLALPCAATAATPAVVPGWPVLAASGTLHPGPGGGPVEIAEGRSFFDGFDGAVSSVAAFAPDGRRRWLSAIPWGCGNCDDGHEQPRLQADGTYGPIGPEGDGSWNVSRRGARVAGCPGAVLADGTRICHKTRWPPGPLTAPFPAVVARRGATQLWEYTQPTLSWATAWVEGAPPAVYAGATTAYTSFGEGSDPARPAPEQLIALDLADGALRWRVVDLSPLAALRDGVIAGAGSRIVSYTAEGTVRWARRLDAAVVVPSQSGMGYARGAGVLVDEAHRRVYVPLAADGVVALDAVTGALVWRTATPDQARPLSVGTGGLLYAGIDRDGRHALRAIGPEGRGRWQFDTTTQVVGARELPSGTVAVSTGGAEPGYRAGLLWRIDPRRPAVRVRAARLSLTHTRFDGLCFNATCEYSPRLGTLLRIAVPRPATLRVRLLAADGWRGTSRAFSVPAPAGVSQVRLFAGSLRGRGILEVRRTSGGPQLVMRVPIVAR